MPATPGNSRGRKRDLMQRVSTSEFEALSGDWDALAESDAGVDRFCARSAWQHSFHQAFDPERDLWLGREGQSMAILAERADGLLEPLENMWGFGAPLIGPESGALLARWLLDRPRPTILLGIPADRDRLAKIVAPLASVFNFRMVSATKRFEVSLEDGLDGWLARRSASFRRNLRSAQRRTQDESVEFRWIEVEAGESAEAHFRTVLDVEARSWKGIRGEGAGDGPMLDFYLQLWPKLSGEGRLRLLLAERDGVAVGYLHGGQVGDHFRGLQFSFDHAFAHLGLGNVMQYQALSQLAASGVERYDLGSYSDYKARWGDDGLETVGLFMAPRS